MKATLVFKSHESMDLSIGMVFTPCITWRIHRGLILNPHAENPHYLPGDFQRLLHLPIFDDFNRYDNGKIVVVTHPEGHGTQEYIDLLLDDIKSQGIKFKVIEI